MKAIVFFFFFFEPREVCLCLDYGISPEEELVIASATENDQSLSDVPELSALHARLRSAAKEKIREDLPDVNPDEIEYTVGLNYKDI